MKASVYRVQRIELQRIRYNDSSWVDVKFYNEEGGCEEVTVHGANKEWPAIVTLEDEHDV